jgi:hypothetical protein
MSDAMNCRTAGVPIVVLTDAESKESRAVNALHIQTFITNPFGHAAGTLITFASGDSVTVAEDFDTVADAFTLDRRMADRCERTRRPLPLS